MSQSSLSPVPPVPFVVESQTFHVDSVPAEVHEVPNKADNSNDMQLHFEHSASPNSQPAASAAITADTQPLSQEELNTSLKRPAHSCSINWREQSRS